MNPLLTLEHVGFAYHQAEGETPALSDISFTLEAGHFLAIVGPSGCGKSTLLSLISGLLLPEEGRILLHGLPVREARANIGYMLQRDHLFEWRTVYTNVLLGLEIQHQKTPEKLQYLHPIQYMAKIPAYCLRPPLTVCLHKLYFFFIKL